MAAEWRGNAEFLAKMSIAAKNRSPEHRAKLSAAASVRNRKRPPDSLAKLTAAAAAARKGGKLSGKRPPPEGGGFWLAARTFLRRGGSEPSGDFWGRLTRRPCLFGPSLARRRGGVRSAFEPFTPWVPDADPRPCIRCARPAFSGGASPRQPRHPRCQGRYRPRQPTDRGLLFQRSFIIINIRGRRFLPPLMRLADLTRASCDTGHSSAPNPKPMAISALAAPKSRQCHS
jgi:hypothetical protein